MELCRICLQGKVTMFNLQTEPLKSCFKAIGSSLDIEIGLPQTVCYICSTQLKKCYSLIRRTCMAKDTLLDIYSRYGDFTLNDLKKYKDDVIQEIYNSKFNLSRQLGTINLPKISINGDIKNKLDDPLNGSYKITNSSNLNRSQKGSLDIDYICDDFKIEEVYTRDFDIDSLKHSIKEDLSEHNETDNDDFEFDKSVMIEVDTEPSSMIDDEDLDNLPLSAVKLEYDLEESLQQEREVKPKQKQFKPRKLKTAIVDAEGLTQREAELKEYFDINVLSIEEQIAEQLKKKEATTYRDALYRCEICYRTHLHPLAHQAHMQLHDASQGEWECLVCKLRFKSKALMTSHANSMHGKKYCCKHCPKTFAKLDNASKHSKRHSGNIYKCTICEHTAYNAPALKNHLRTTHSVGGCVCTQCGHTYSNFRGLRLHAWRQHHIKLPSALQADTLSCRKCDMQFSTEEALEAHSETPHLDSDSVICSTCGQDFRNQNELKRHASLIHSDDSKWGLASSTYPAKCEYCGQQVNNRKEHYFHVRKSHPKERENYQAVVTAICVTCGKGFQNATKLHLHELRHKGILSVSCPHCPRLFYDKFHLSRHIGVHSDERPFACKHCDKSFKLRSNLDRHAKVHSNVTAYECSLCNKRFRYSSSRNLHIKTVHYKMPQPPRKRRTAKSNKTLNSYDGCMQ